MADLTLFLASSGSAPHDCAYSDYWDNVTGAAHLPGNTTKGSTAIAVRNNAYVRYDVNCLGGQWVSPAMAARSWTPDDTFDIAIICRDNNYPTTTWKLHVSIRVFNAAGDTEVGVLFEGEVNSTAFIASWQNRHADGVALQNSVSMPENGHLVIEIGAAATYEASSYESNIVVGEQPANPLPLNDTETNTDSYYAWIGFTYGVDTPGHVAYEAFIGGPQATPVWVSPPMLLQSAWDATLLKVAGTDRTITWSIRKVASGAISEAFAGTQSVTTDEHSLPRDATYSGGSPQAADGLYQIFLDVNALAGGDLFRFRVYEETGV